MLNRGTFEKMFEAARLCRERALDIPMLVLIYTTIDTLAWAIYGDSIREVKRRFVAVCDDYVLREASFGCTALELYAARCSVLHSLGWESELSKAGKARAIYYSFGTDDPALYQQAIELSHPGQFLAVRADDLLTATEKAVASVSEAAKSDSALKERLDRAEGKQYRTLESKSSDAMFARYIEMAKNGGRT
jgi:hypothetical protein